VDDFLAAAMTGSMSGSKSNAELFADDEDEEEEEDVAMTGKGKGKPVIRKSTVSDPSSSTGNDSDSDCEWVHNLSF
jgi:hypothetical protein